MTLESFLGGYAETLSHGGILLTLGIALVAGIIASGVCPCTVPVGIGMAGLAGVSETQSRARGFLIALAFFAGVVINLSVLGAVAGRLGAVLTQTFGVYWALGMGLLSLTAAGFAFFGPRMKAEKLAALRRPGLSGAFAYGFIFSLGTSAAPLLLLLTMAAASANPIGGLLLAFTFGVGRGLPFLVIGFFGGALARLVGSGIWRRGLQIASGIFLLLVSGYFFRAFAALI
jgi:cytochrome c-type biogenesis protein